MHSSGKFLLSFGEEDGAGGGVIAKGEEEARSVAPAIGS